MDLNEVVPHGVEHRQVGVVVKTFAERSNLSIRMGSRRMTRLTNAFSKKAENHAHMMAIYFMHYNFVPIHQTLQVTPAMGNCSGPSGIGVRPGTVSGRLRWPGGQICG